MTLWDHKKFFDILELRNLAELVDFIGIKNQFRCYGEKSHSRITQIRWKSFITNY